ncbi:MULTISPECIES: chaplin [unclassified Streptomyces]|uniref:chaplin n=1 Tax=unclassified Streptomyces TaxID=2593676 RepID=UPI0033259FD1
MRQTLGRGMVVAAAATGILSLYTGTALADTDATGSASGAPGVVSGNVVQAPVDVPVNLCGNSVDVAAVLNPALGNSCANTSASAEPTGERAHDTSYGDSAYGDSSDAGPAYGSTGCDAGYGAEGATATAPPAYGEETPPPCEETTPPPSPTPPPSHTPPPTRTPPPSPTPPPTWTPPSPTPSTPVPTPPPGDHQSPPPSLPHTGSDRTAMAVTSAASAALIAAGTLLFRRGRAASRRS